jgi:methionyl-tRNA formyltransferase
MIKTVFLGSRLSALRDLHRYEQLDLLKLYFHDGGGLHRKLDSISLPASTQVDLFSDKCKARVVAELEDMEFDLLISNGYPFILPVSKIKKPAQVFVNVHPTLLPDLKGKTPLNGVFFTKRSQIGATMHHMDDGIDSGRIIAQAAVDLTPDIDQGLVYAISFALESEAFKAGMDKLMHSGLQYAGEPQVASGSYFNRSRELQTIDVMADDSDIILRKIRSFGIKGQGSFLSIEGRDYTVYSAEMISNPYLLATYGKGEPGTIALEYDGKILLRTKDGLVKLTDYEAS